MKANPDVPGCFEVLVDDELIHSRIVLPFSTINFLNFLFLNCKFF